MIFLYKNKDTYVQNKVTVFQHRKQHKSSVTGDEYIVRTKAHWVKITA